jgi:hypothetical protein
MLSQQLLDECRSALSMLQFKEFKAPVNVIGKEERAFDFPGWWLTALQRFGKFKRRG